MTHICQIRLLGDVQIQTEADLLRHFRSRKAVALLAYLIRHKQPLSRPHLADLWWGNQAETQGRANLRRELAYLTTLLPGCFEVDRQTIQFKPIAPCWIDTNAFDELAPPPRPAQPKGNQSRQTEMVAATWRSFALSTPEEFEAQVTRLAEASTLYRGDFMAGFTLDGCPEFEMWLLGEQEAWRQRVTSIFDCLTVYYGLHQRNNQALLYARRWLEVEPWQEVAHQHRMRLMARTGQRSAALAQYEICRRILADELGVEPSAETDELYRHIQTGELGPELKERGTISPPPLTTVAPGTNLSVEQLQFTHKLPLQSTPFIGREKELADLARFLDDRNNRIVTVLAPGGMGKTRLALAAADDQLNRLVVGPEPFYPRGVYFVPLAPVGEVPRLVSSIAGALGFQLAVGAQQTRTPEQQLLDYLHQKQLLLILDSFDYLLSSPKVDPGAAELVADILQTAPGVQILVTSRERLNLSGEQVYPIEGLDFPDEEKILTDQDPATLITEFAAFKLFWLSARRARPDFELATDGLPYLGQICRLVQGMPLGIELAATWVSLLPLADIVAEIRLSLDFLEIDARDVPQRHRSLRAVFDTSWSYLSEAEQKVFARLSVFRGGFTRQAGQKICDASLRVLSSLAGKSFLQYNPARDRYQIHELLSQYGGDKMAGQTRETSAVKDRHSHYYLNGLYQREAALKGAGQQTALAEIEADIENVWAAWHWALARGNLEHLKPAMDSLGYFYKLQGRYQEGLRAYRLVVEALAETAPPTSPQQTLVAAKAMAWKSVFDRLLGQNESAGNLLQQSLALLDDPVLADQDIRLEQAFTWLQMGHLVILSNLDEALSWYDQSLALYQALPDPWGAAQALAVPPEVHIGVEVTIAKERYEKSLSLRRRLGDKRGIADNLATLSTLARYEGNATEALRLAEECLVLYREIGNPAGIAKGLNNLAKTKAIGLGQCFEAYDLLQACVAIYRDLGGHSSLPMLYAELGLVTTLLGRPDEGRTHVNQALDLARELGNEPAVDFSLNVLGFISLASAAYDEAQRILQDRLGIHQKGGRLWDRSSAFALTCLAYVAKRLRNINQARDHLVSMLYVVSEFHNSFAFVIALPLIALLLAEQSRAKGEIRLQTRAMELYGLAWRHPLIANMSLFEDMVGKELVAIASTLPPKVVEVAQNRGRALDLWQTADELLEELSKLGWGTLENYSSLVLV